MGRALSTTWKHIRRSPYLALAAIFSMMLTFLIMSILIFFMVGSSLIIQYFESKPQVTAFFKDEATPEEINGLESQIREAPDVANIKFVSKKEALEIYREQNKEDPLLLDLVTENILPASLEVSATKIDSLAPLAEVMKGSPAVGQVIYQKDIIDTLSVVASKGRNTGIVTFIIFAIFSILLMGIIIGFKVSQKRDEIEIMKLLSATNWYVRWPFVFEGIFYGVVGAFFGWLLATLGLLYATPYLRSFLGEIPVLPAPITFLFGVLILELLVATLFGAISSFLAVFRYLK